MLRILVDSGSSIKQAEAEKYGVEIIPLIISFDGVEYLDGINLSHDEFYNKLINEKKFPKTSLPNLYELKEKVTAYTNAGDDVLILPISSGISGTYNAIRNLFLDNAKVKVVDTKYAVGGIRLIVHAVNQNKDKSLDELETIINNLIPRIKILAIPETLTYLMRGGRLSKKDWILGSMLNIKPIITFKDGSVAVQSKKIGLGSAMKAINSEIERVDVDENFPIVASYTYNKSNVEKLISGLKDKFKKFITVFDDLASVIACHWGPNAFGYVFVQK